MKELIKIIFLLFIISIKCDETIDFSSSLSSGKGYTVNDNTVTIFSDGIFTLKGTSINKNILVSSNCSLILDSLSLNSNGTLTPLIIESYNSISMHLKGSSILIDSSSNENEGIIYLKSGASLNISGDGTLNLIPNKNMAINGTNSTSLTVNGGNIKITSTSSETGGIYLRKQITFNDCTFTYLSDSSNSETKKHAIDSEGNINIIKGIYKLNNKSGKGIQSEKNVYLGKEGSDNNFLIIDIQTYKEGIEAEKIEVYSGKITIDSQDDGINAAGAECEQEGECKGNCTCYILFKGGEIDINSNEDGLDSNGDIYVSKGKIIVYGASTGKDQPIDKDGLLTIEGGTIFAAGSNERGEISANNSQDYISYSETIEVGKIIKITDRYNKEVFSLKNKKLINYLYFTSSGSGFNVNIFDESKENNLKPHSTKFSLAKILIIVFACIIIIGIIVFFVFFRKKLCFSKRFDDKNSLNKEEEDIELLNNLQIV